MENPQQDNNSALLYQRFHAMRDRIRRPKGSLLSEIRKVVVKPWFWLVFQTAILFLVFECTGGLEVHRPDTGSDDQEYLDLSRVPFVELMSDTYLAWSGLTLGVFLAYQVRAAYLFLIPLLPLLDLLILVFVAPRPVRLRQRLLFGLILVLACSLPFLGFCTFRLAKVEHFGLTSSGGYTSIHIVGQFLTDDLVPELPPGLQPLAMTVLENRKKLIRGEIPCAHPPLPVLAERADQMPELARWRPPGSEPQGRSTEEMLNEQAWICLATTWVVTSSSSQLT